MRSKKKKMLSEQTFPTFTSIDEVEWLWKCLKAKDNLEGISQNTNPKNCFEAVGMGLNNHLSSCRTVKFNYNKNLVLNKLI